MKTSPARRWWWAVLAAAAGCAAAPPCAPVPFSGEVETPGDYRDGGSGLVFPPRTGGFTRRMVYRYGGSEDATLVAYDHERADAPATVEFFLVPRVRAGGERERLEALAREELKSGASGRRLYTAPVELAGKEGLKTVIERPMGFAGNRQRVTVVLYLVPFREFLFRVRVVYPVSVPPDVPSRARALIEKVAASAG